MNYLKGRISNYLSENLKKKSLSKQMKNDQEMLQSLSKNELVVE